MAWSIQGGGSHKPTRSQERFRPGSGRGKRVGAEGGVPPPTQPVPVFGWMAAQVRTPVLLAEESVFDQSRWQTDKRLCLFANTTSGSVSGAQMERFMSHSYELRVLSGARHGGKGLRLLKCIPWFVVLEAFLWTSHLALQNSFGTVDTFSLKSHMMKPRFRNSPTLMKWKSQNVNPGPLFAGLMLCSWLWETHTTYESTEQWDRAFL